MTGFYIGMLAFALWVGVMIGIYRAVKTTPGHPFWSMARFKNARQSIAPDQTPPVPREPLELAEPTQEKIDLVHFDLSALGPEEPIRPDPAMDASISLDPSEEEMREVEAMLNSIAAPKKPRPPRAPRKRHSGPIRSGRMTYILVDDEGRPEL